MRDAAADHHAQRSSALPCTMQQQIAVCNAAADRRAQCSSGSRRIPSRVRYGVPSTRHWVFSLPGTRHWVPRVPATPTLKYLYPGCWVRVFRGWGRGSLSQPQGYPCQSLNGCVWGFNNPSNQPGYIVHRCAAPNSIYSYFIVNIVILYPSQLCVMLCHVTFSVMIMPLIIYSLM
jgi:hypothetical protein